MLLRVVFFLLMALGLVGFGTVAYVSTRPPAKHLAAAKRPPTKEMVLIAARPVHAGSLLRPDDIAAKPVPIAEASDATKDTPSAERAMIGAMARRMLVRGEMIQNTDILRPGDHGFLAAVLQPGMRAVTIAVDSTSGTAGLIWPGDRVDLILTQTLGPHLSPGKRVAAETVLSDIRVLAIDQQIVQGAAPTSNPNRRTVTLEVTQNQAERVAVATRLGRLSLTVRSAEAPRNVVATAPKRGRTVWAMDVSRALGAEATRSTGQTMRLYLGAKQAQEFRF